MKDKNITIKKINTNAYHPQQKFMARYDLSPFRFEIGYGHTKKEATDDMYRLLRRYRIYPMKDK